MPTTFAVNTTADLVTSFPGVISLREAITLANAHPGPDTILLPASTYTNAYLVGSERLYLLDPGAHEPREQERLFETIDARLADESRSDSPPGAGGDKIEPLSSGWPRSLLSSLWSMAHEDATTRGSATG